MRILIVEDNEKHLKDAISALGIIPGVDVETAENEYWAHKALKDSSFDGVITDIFIPHMHRAPYDNSNEPCGLAVALECEQKGIPFVICTDGHHHGARHDWITCIGRARGWPEMIDGGRSDEKPAEKKDWAGAFKALQRVIEKKK